ncbi:MAG: hypothetical protein A3F46_00320 [Legionellales bacterium RIFCSPHIGHO2_12_FULL_42_9]|nr:MAG: hypothetical protein A3F46_00320 [Legionellales bacterium RIFCSPHIGHO2_12_FULL_42_9]
MIKAKSFGFTLIEILCTLSILSLSVFCVFTLSERFLIANENYNLTAQLMNMVNYSRNMALFTNLNLTINPYHNDWSCGVVLFIDNKNHHYSGHEKIIHIWSWKLKFLQLSWHGLLADDYLTFSNNLNHAITNGHFTISQNVNVIRRIVLNRLSRVIIK